MRSKLSHKPPGNTFRVHPASRILSPEGHTLTKPGADTDAVIGLQQHGQLLLISDDQTYSALTTSLAASRQGLEFCLCSAETYRAISDADSTESGLTTGHTERRQNTEPHFQCQSSGSSGAARRVRRSHQSWIKSFHINRSLLNLTQQDSYALIGNLSHSLPLYAALEALYIGADLHLLSKLRSVSQLQALRNLQTTILYLTPSQARLLCKASAHRASNTPYAIRKIMCGGGKLDPATRKGLNRLFPHADVFEFYGASETSFITISDDSSPSESVGKAYPGVTISVRDKAGKPTNEIGLIWAKSLYLFSTYAAGPWRDTRWDDGYLSVGEMGRMDSDGYLYLSGRQSRMANIADKSIFLQDIEQLIIQNTDTMQCVVLAKADALRGQVLVAILEGPENEQLRTSIQVCIRKHLGSVLIPRTIIFLENLPQLPAGKPDIQHLQTMIDRI